MQNNDQIDDVYSRLHCKEMEMSQNIVDTATSSSGK